MKNKHFKGGKNIWSNDFLPHLTGVWKRMAVCSWGPWKWKMTKTNWLSQPTPQQQKKTTLLRNVLPYFVPHFSPALHKRFYYTSYLLSVEGGLKRCLIFPQKLLMRNKKNKFPLLQCCFLFGLDLVVKGANFTFPWCAWKGKMTKASSRVWLW